jgi:hypothetical protein
MQYIRLWRIFVVLLIVIITVHVSSGHIGDDEQTPASSSGHTLVVQ